ncbi:MAG: hypothetical protein MZV63_41345 [Marinilabiliales bacterium]|nr:hypothetical protein [Marinilabiliales bacterium]
MAANVYGDAGMVVQERKVSMDDVPAYINKADYFSDGPEYPHVTVGGACTSPSTSNTVFTAEIGKAVNKQDGNIGIYVWDRLVVLIFRETPYCNPWQLPRIKFDEHTDEKCHAKRVTPGSRRASQKKFIDRLQPFFTPILERLH